MAEHHSAFRWLRRQHLSNLNLEFQEFEHKATGIRHIHLASSSEEKVFMVAFRTMPMNSTGVAHVLEHTVLCGSERYPVRDPFFMMIRRSLNTFMNAMTAGDWTAYPFATQNDKDFYNLLSVYLDAVFFPRLHPLDFAQEGIRMELADPEHPEDSALVFKGVVFNEMKGAMSSAVSQLYECMNKYLFPSTTYHYNSGGDPVFIQDLTHADLLAFHRHHYHPSNAILLSFGQLDLSQLQEQIETLALQRFEGRQEPVRGRDEKRYMAPLRIEESYPLDESDPSAKTHIVMAWLMGRASDLDHALDMAVLGGILFNHSASPLRMALEQTDLAASASPLCGVGDDSRQLVMMAGVEGSESQHADAVEALIMNVLRDLAEKGVDFNEAESVLHQIELNEREIGGDRYPYGLSLLMSLIGPVLQDADPLPLLDWSIALQRAREKIRQPDYIPGLIRTWLLDNTHRIRLVLKPDAAMSDRARAEEAAELARRAAGMTNEDRRQLLEAAHQLEQRQAEQDPADCLPRVTREDIPADLPEEPVQWTWESTAGVRVHGGFAGTNGLAYGKWIVPMPEIAPHLIPWLPLYRNVFGELGAGADDYQARQRRLSAQTGGINLAELSFPLLGTDVAQSMLILSGKALNRNNDVLLRLMLEQLDHLRFDQPDRIRELMQQMRLRWDHGVTQEGHQLAMGRAAASMSSLGAWRAAQRGLVGLRFLRSQDQKLVGEPEGLGDVIKFLQEIHERVKAQPRTLLWVGEDALQDELRAALNGFAGVRSGACSASLPVLSHTGRDEAWVTQTQVQFCAMSFPAVGMLHTDAAALRLLGPIMRNRTLHSALRERGGAYGGGATYAAEESCFHLFSYRDPRLEGTYDDFLAAVEDVRRHPPTQEQLDEALLNLIAAMDKPASPAGEVMQVLTGHLTGRDRALRVSIRQQLLATRVEDIQRVAQTWLVPERARRIAIVPADCEARAMRMGFALESLL